MVSNILSSFLSNNVGDESLEKRHLKRLELLSDLMKETVEDWIEYKTKTQKNNVKKQKREAWRQKIGLGQSIMATLYGDGPYRTMFNLFLEKVKRSKFELTKSEAEILNST